uniref:28 kDa Metastriate family member n=1 Tax=Rhipicephalus appendiculatus TaxID=34631 RepID=A0A131Z942_RHIAP
MTKAILFVFLLYIAAASASRSVDEDVLWALPVISQGVNVYAEVFYDSTLQSEGSSRNAVIHDIFKLAEQYFHNYSVMINFKVQIRDQMTDAVRVMRDDGETLKPNETLEEFKKQVPRQSHRNNSIFYLFTKTPMIGKLRVDDEEDTEFRYYGTFDSFCSGSTSAVLVHHHPEEHYINVVKATAHTFGIHEYPTSPLADFFQMLLAFEYCRQNTCSAQCLEQCGAEKAK